MSLRCVCAVGLLFTLSSCDSLEEFLGAWGHGAQDAGAPEADGGAPEPHPEPYVVQAVSTVSSAPLPGGRVLRVSSLGVQIVDIRDRQTPKIEGVYNVGNAHIFAYVVDDHLYLLVADGEPYQGARPDVRRLVGGASVRSLDIRDYTQPTLIERTEAIADGDEHIYIVGSALVRRDDKADLYVSWGHYELSPQSRFTRVWTDHFELIDGHITRLETIEGGGNMLLATPDLLVTARSEGSDEVATTRLSVHDISGRALSERLTAILPGALYSPSQLKIEHGHLRAAVTGRIYTFDLAATGSVDPLATCMLDPRSTTMFLSPDQALSTMTIYDDRFGPPAPGVRRHAFDATGACTVLATEYSDVWYFHPVSDTRYFTLSAPVPDLPNVRLYDSTSPPGTPPLTASFGLGSFGDSGVYVGAVAATAPDGTVERDLLLDMGISDTVQGVLQLATFSDRTLTARGALVTSGFPPDLAQLYDASTAIAWNSGRALLIDLEDLDAPKVISRINFERVYRSVFIFGDYSVRVLVDYGALTDTDEVVVFPLSYTGDFDPPIASTSLPASGEWYQTAQLLLSAGDRDYVDAQGVRTNLFEFQVFDLSDPARLRPAARFTNPALQSDGSKIVFAFDTALVVARPTRNATNRYLVDVVDLTDPDQPVLARDDLPFPSGASQSVQFRFPFENTLFVDVTQNGQQYAYGIDFADPYAPVVGAPIRVPGTTVAATATDLYAFATDESGDTTLSRVSRSGDSRIAAAQTWRARKIANAKSDSAGHLLVTTEPHRPPLGEDPNDVANWSRLEIVDETTLEILGGLDLDHYSWCTSAIEGRALCSVVGGLLVVDIRDATAPKMQAYLPGLTATLAAGRGRIIRAQSSPLGWNIPIDTINLPQ